MRLTFFAVLILLSVFCALTKSEDRHDVHRIILKPERNKRHKKQTRGKTHYKQNYGYQSAEFEPVAHGASDYQSQEGSYVKHRYKPQQYNNHHAEYQNLIKPRPPKPDDFVINYPEEEQAYQATLHNQHYVPYHSENSANWSPIPTQSNYIITQKPQIYDFGIKSTPSTVKRKKKTRRKSAETTPLAPTSFLEFTSTTKPFKTKLPLIIRNQNLQAQGSQHYVTVNHNNKSVVKYEVSTTPKIYQHNLDEENKFISSYEVYEQLDDFKQPKQTSFNNLGQVLGPYPQIFNQQHFLPTISTFIDHREPVGIHKDNNNNSNKNINNYYGKRIKTKSSTRTPF